MSIQVFDLRYYKSSHRYDEDEMSLLWLMMCCHSLMVYRHFYDERCDVTLWCYIVTSMMNDVMSLFDGYRHFYDERCVVTLWWYIVTSMHDERCDVTLWLKMWCHSLMVYCHFYDEWWDVTSMINDEMLLYYDMMF